MCALWWIAAHAATWTIHGAKDNYLQVTLVGPVLNCESAPISEVRYWGDPDHTRGWMSFGYWDYANDVAYPPGYSGALNYTNQCGDYYTWGYSQSEWQETLMFEGDADIVIYSLWGPFPDYNGTDQSGNLSLLGGEFWIDFDSFGIVRVSVSEWPDFGKWAWDGSINPSWVEPLAGKKQHGKGHGK